MTTIQRLCVPTFLALTAFSGGCDSFSDEGVSASGSTSSGTGETSETAPPTTITISDSASPPATTEPPDTDSGATGSSTDASDTDTSDTDFPSTSGDTDSSSTTVGETDGDTDSTGTTQTDDTIYEVQMGDIAEGSAVVLEGVVVTGVRAGIGMFIQEPGGGQFSGVYVDTGDIDLSGFSVGDIVDVTGVTSEDIPNPNPASLVGLTGVLTDEGVGDVVAAGGTMDLAPASVTAADLSAEAGEPWESVLVTLEGPLTVSKADFDAFGEFRVSDGDSDVLIDNFLYGIFEKANAGDFPGFSVGATFASITGPLDFSFGNFKVAPRSAAELAGYVAD